MRWDIKVWTETNFITFRIEEEELGNGEVKFLKQKEIRFWQELIPKYLKPLDKDKEKEKQQAAGLKVCKYFRI